jgi:predicted N-acetyltransferase YhbS
MSDNSVSNQNPVSEQYFYEVYVKKSSEQNDTKTVFPLQILKNEGIEQNFIEYMTNNNIIIQKKNVLGTSIDPYNVVVHINQTYDDYKYTVKHTKIWISSQIQVREMKSTDYEAIIQLQKVLNGYSVTYGQEVFADRLKEIYKSNGYPCVATMNGQVVGSIKLLIETKFTAPVGHIEDVVVLDPYRGLGICGLLIKHVQEIARNAKCYKIILDCKDEYVPMYGHCGFKEKLNCLTNRLIYS